MSATSIFRRSQRERQAQLQELLLELDKVKLKLGQAYGDFNATLEPELIECCIYEINALQARYAYLLRQIKESGCENVARFRFPAKSKEAKV